MLPRIARAHRIIIAASATTILLALAATALAAHPKAGKHYSGFESLSAINKFRAPVKFKVNSAGTKLRAFEYSSLGCAGAGGFGNSDPYTLPAAIHKVGTIKVSKSGRFSVKDVTTTFSSHGFKTTTISSVSGSFSSSKMATGTITFKQRFSHHGTPSCKGLPITFAATLK